MTSHEPDKSSKIDLDAIVAPHLTNSTGARGCRLSQPVHAGRHSFLRKTGRHADLQHVLA